MKGQKVLQGYLSAKNPVDTWVSGTFAIAFWTVNHLWHLGKYNLGLSSCLGGTGMCISADIVREFGWGWRTVSRKTWNFHEMPFLMGSAPAGFMMRLFDDENR